MEVSNEHFPGIWQPKNRSSRFLKDIESLMLGLGDTYTTCLDTVSNRRRPHSTLDSMAKPLLRVKAIRETTMGVDGRHRHSCMRPRSAPALRLDLLRQNEPFRSPLDKCAST